MGEHPRLLPRDVKPEGAEFRFKLLADELPRRQAAGVAGSTRLRLRELVETLLMRGLGFDGACLALAQ